MSEAFEKHIATKYGQELAEFKAEYPEIAGSLIEGFNVGIEAARKEFTSLPGGRAGELSCTYLDRLRKLKYEE